MKNILLYILLLAAVMSYGQGLLPEEKIRKEPPAQPVHQAKKYDWKGEYYEGLARVSLNGKLGFIDKTGKKIIPIKYFTLYDFSEGLAVIGNIDLSSRVLDEKYGFVDKIGNEIIPMKYNKAKSFSEGLAGVEKNYKWIFINKMNKKAIPFEYDDIYSFSKGIAKVKLNGRWFYINKKGECVKDCRYAPSNYPRTN